VRLDDKLKLLKSGVRVSSTSALAPGGWTQVAIERGVTNIVGVDLLPVDPLPPAHILEMDFTDPECAPQADRVARRPAGPCVVGHGAQHRRPSSHRSPADHRL
jgi:23S rRNA U2552 (ribose-2'-O)-methylase RlmE/FtsJ